MRAAPNTSPQQRGLPTQQGCWGQAEQPSKQSLQLTDVALLSSAKPCNALRDVFLGLSCRAPTGAPRPTAPHLPRRSQTSPFFLPALAGSLRPLGFAVTALRCSGRRLWRWRPGRRRLHAHLATPQACRMKGVVFVLIMVEAACALERGRPLSCSTLSFASWCVFIEPRAALRRSCEHAEA